MEVLYIVMPAYNEGKNIRDVVRLWYPKLRGRGEASRLVIADSGSTDSTHKILEEMKQKYPKLVVLSDTGKQHGPKVIALYKYAMLQGADYIFQTDSDGQTDPDEFEMFWDMRTRYDAIIGCRQIREDGKSRAFVEQVVCFLLRIYFGINVSDANAPFRLMKMNVVEKYIDRFLPEYSLPNIMMTTFFVYYDERVTFVPITFRARQDGTSSIDIVTIVKIGWKSLGEFARFKKDM